MKYPGALIPFLALALNAQISNLATNADGSELQFASQYRLKGEPDPTLADRIYRYLPGQPELLARTTPNTAGARPVAPYISDDGQTRGWFLNRPCRPGGVSAARPPVNRPVPTTARCSITSRCRW